jgi:hypothetical protein
MSEREREREFSDSSASKPRWLCGSAAQTQGIREDSIER